MKLLIFFLFILQIIEIPVINSAEEAEITGMAPPDADDGLDEYENTYDEPQYEGDFDEDDLGELLDEGDDDSLDEEEVGEYYDPDEDDDSIDEEELAAMLEELGIDNLEDFYAEFAEYGDDGYDGEYEVGAEYEDEGFYEDEFDLGDYDPDFDTDAWEDAEDELGDWYDVESWGDLDISEGDLIHVDYCEHFTAPEDGAMKMDFDRCSEVESAFCDCESRPDFYYTPEQCLMLKYQFSFDYLMQDCCLDESVENELCSDYMEALALCECHPDEGECTEDEMMEDCDYLWDETMHMCRNITANMDWPLCDDEPEERNKDDLRRRLTAPLPEE